MTSHQGLWKDGHLIKENSTFCCMQVLKCQWHCDQGTWCHVWELNCTGDSFICDKFGIWWEHRAILACCGAWVPCCFPVEMNEVTVPHDLPVFFSVEVAKWWWFLTWVQGKIQKGGMLKILLKRKVVKIHPNVTSMFWTLQVYVLWCELSHWRLPR